MFRAKTILVLGAGASAELGLPLGAELLRKIVDLTKFRFDFGALAAGDRVVFDALTRCMDEGPEVEKLNAHLEAGRQLGRSAQQALSIDNVIEGLEDPKIELVGKICIVRSILNAERASHLFSSGGRTEEAPDLSNFEGTWYWNFTQLLTENVPKSRIDKIFENIEIINFNYDRCLEQYLPYSLANYYGVDVAVTRELMRNLVVHRPYGSVGRLPWQGGDSPSVPFGRADGEQLSAVAQLVRTFTERVSEGGELEAMRAAISCADRIVFLGFAFHRQNVRLLAHPVEYHAEIMGTAFGISQSDRSVIEDELLRAFELERPLVTDSLSLPDLPCKAFFMDYWRTLTAEKSDRTRDDFEWGVA